MEIVRLPLEKRELQLDSATHSFFTFILMFDKLKRNRKEANCHKNM